MVLTHHHHRVLIYHQLFGNSPDVLRIVKQVPYEVDRREWFPLKRNVLVSACRKDRSEDVEIQTAPRPEFPKIQLQLLPKGELGHLHAHPQILLEIKLVRLNEVSVPIKVFIPVHV
jgi:hypothetical protein